MLMYVVAILSLLSFKDGVFATDQVDNNVHRIVGGVQVSLGSIPYQVTVERITVSGAFCGGSLISLRHCISAAHCFLYNNAVNTTPSIYQVKAGQIDRLSTSWQTRTPFRITTHPNFDEYSLQADIAVITLASEFVQTTAVAPVGILSSSMSVGTVCSVSGWGYLWEGSGVLSRYLMAVDVSIKDQTICTNAYRTIGLNIYSDMVCAGDDLLLVDACQGDSGGPLTCNGLLTGVVSWGQGCARPGFYGVYTRVEVYNRWIENIVNGSWIVNSSFILLLMSITTFIFNAY